MLVLEANVDVVFASWDWYVDEGHDTIFLFLLNDISLAGAVNLHVNILWINIAILQVVRSCIQLSPRYGATLLTRRHTACRCNLASSLWSTSSFALVVPTTRWTTIVDRAFAVAGPRAWNRAWNSSLLCKAPSYSSFPLHTVFYNCIVYVKLHFMISHVHCRSLGFRRRSFKPVA